MIDITENYLTTSDYIAPPVRAMRLVVGVSTEEHALLLALRKLNNANDHRNDCKDAAREADRTLAEADDSRWAADDEWHDALAAVKH